MHFCPNHNHLWSYTLYTIYFQHRQVFKVIAAATAAHLPENYTFDSLTEFLCKSTAEKWKIIFCCSICGTRSTLQQLSYKASFKNDLEPKTRRLHQKKNWKIALGCTQLQLAADAIVES